MDVFGLRDRLIGDYREYTSGFLTIRDYVDEQISHDSVRLVSTALTDGGIPWQGLERYDGVPTPKVKVGTFHRAKGAGVQGRVLARPQRRTLPVAQVSQSGRGGIRGVPLPCDERALRCHDQARDRLVVLYAGEPSEVLAHVDDRFEHAVVGPA
ncbi:MAG: hypothetical protein ACR2KP_01535 [Egibacteraceae bacterium]